MAEYSPGPYMKMTPAGIPGILAVLLVVFGVAGLYGVSGFITLAVISVISLGLAAVIGSWHVRHQIESTPLHLGLGVEQSDRGPHIGLTPGILAAILGIAVAMAVLGTLAYLAVPLPVIALLVIAAVGGFLVLRQR